ncbi:choline/carnitine O-acyltransferase [Pseudonocardia sp. RS11V-5]|uniref:choline/carnitine O-acyltransferase n=1 Tax=Pseudonocardia terrae TaxID=2905831 RepID=UPI001E64CDE5|nr:choline/carnitine O-acyltransferase [Pseudonocardia terrae]MCE3552882.1 choline/carnitine O-acyltransferase [Pseudonocardia terrae]
MTFSPLTFGNEDALPRVPLPALTDTAARFLDWCAPLLTDDERARTEKALDEFLAGEAPELDAALRAYDATPGVHSVWDDFWRSRYLGRRDRIALNANFFFLFEDAPGLGRIERAAALTAATVAYKLAIDAQAVPPATQRGKPLSMVQLKYLFSACRIPGREIDSSRTPYTDAWPGPSTERHIVVFHHGHVVRLDVLAADGTPHSVAEIADGLRAIVAATEARGDAVGHLTTKARAAWAQTRDRLRAENAETLEAIETALFCVALEDAVPAEPREACDLLLHGDSGNRWFDKSLTLIVFGDGTAGLNGEHCELDGTTVVGYVDTILDTPTPELPGAGPTTVIPLTWRLDDDLRADIARSGAEFGDYAAACATSTLSIDGFTSARAKELRCSPDAFAQLAFQLAHRRSKGFTGATYESIATRRYHHGRTEAMRVVTPEIVAFVDAMTDPATNDDVRRAAFRVAAEAHVRRAKECQAGHAPEQHLWELQWIQRRPGGPEIPFFDSPGWTILRDDYLSTSSVPSPRVQYFGFGSTSPTCIGVGYGLQHDRFDIYLATPRSVADQMYAFADRVREAVAELDTLLAAEAG